MGYDWIVFVPGKGGTLHFKEEVARLKTKRIAKKKRDRVFLMNLKTGTMEGGYHVAKGS